MNVHVRKTRQTIPTYIPKPPSDLPMFFEKRPYQGASGRVYPLPYSDGIRDEKQDVEYDVFVLENEYIKTVVLPAVGGKILRGLDKIGAYDFIYYNEVIKPALVGLAGPWISGGIEFNFPQHHRPTTFSPLETVTQSHPDGSQTVWTGEVDPFYRLKSAAGITLEPGRSYIKAKIRVYNRTAQPQKFMWWANLAVPVNDDYRTVFPPDVEWVNDHDRRAVLEWPVAKGVYQTARPFDYGEGTDLSKYSAVKVPSSFLVSQGQSDMDFVAGYDDGIQKGIVTVADHHISPGKKMWHWGAGEFGDMWCSNLTDRNGPYIELMTGVYTDNQPDFTWIAPYESREFEQMWYPVRDIGDVKNASRDAAMNLEERDGGAFVGFHATGTFENAVVTLRSGGALLFSETVTLTPATPYTRIIPLNGRELSGVTASLAAEDGRVLVAYTPCKRGQKQPIEPRRPVARPEEMESVEELYINGLHLEQYKQHNYNANEYYLEGLRRDPGDARCNTSMARLCLKNGEFEKSLGYADAAIRRLTSRNEHPADTEALYLSGLALEYLGSYEQAYDRYARAAWNYPHRCAACYAMALLDCRRGAYDAALEQLDISIRLQTGHLNGLNLKAAVLRRMGCLDAARRQAEETAAMDRLDLWARWEAHYFGDDLQETQALFAGKPESFLDVVCEYMRAGWYEEAVDLLDAAPPDYPLVAYYRAYCRRMSGGHPAEDLAAAGRLDTGACFPSRVEDIAVLKAAAEHNPNDANAWYYLGCLYYDRFRYEDAVACWEGAVERNPGHGKALRNLAVAYFDKRGDAASARRCMERALTMIPDEPRLLFEYQQLLKNMDVPADERLAVYERYPDLLNQRDDCYLDKIILLCMKGRYKQAIDLAASRHFHIYEGGEGKLTKQHTWMHVLYGNALAAQGNMEEAEAVYRRGLVMPKSYGEAKTWFNQEAHLYYYLGLLLESAGRTQEADAAFREAAADKAVVSELSVFRALALRRLDRYTQAKTVLDEMLAQGDDDLRNAGRYSYFGVGSPTPMPFEYDIVKTNRTNGHILMAHAYWGLGRTAQAEYHLREAEALSPNDFRIYALRQTAGIS